jgi:hypothetical protein
MRTIFRAGLFLRGVKHVCGHAAATAHAGVYPAWRSVFPVR